MAYKPIQPIDFPNLRNVFLGYQKSPFWLPQINFLDGYIESVSAELVSNTSTDVLYRRNLSFLRLSANPLKLRHNGNTADMEIYLDMYSYVQDEGLVQPGEQFPPANPYGLNWSRDDYYLRSTSLYIYESITVPPASSLVWDGRYSYCVNKNLQNVNSASRLNKVRGEARAALENSELVPSFTTSLGALGKTKRTIDVNVNRSTYDNTMIRWLIANYNPDSIPPVPTTYSDLPIYTVNSTNSNSNTTTQTPVLLSSNIAAMLDGDYFVQWITIYTYGSGLQDSN